MSALPQPVVLPALKNILYTTDLSESSRVAIPYICAIAGWYGASVHLVHVIPPEPMLEVPLDLPRELDSDLDVALQEMRALLAGRPFANAKCTMTVERGYLWPVLVRCIEERDIDLIVVGTHGRSGISKLVRGSMAEQILRQSPLPVLTVGPHCAWGDLLPTGRTVLFATDFSANAGRALAYAAYVCQVNQARLVLLHSVVPDAPVVPSTTVLDAEDFRRSQYVESGLELAHTKTNRLASDEMLRGIDVETIVEVGDPAEMILSCAGARRADLIVMGVHRSDGGKMASHLPWATASSVVRQARCPVLTVRS